MSPIIKSIAGIRGTIGWGGKNNEGFSPSNIVQYTSAYAFLMRSKHSISNTILIGRDARVSGAMIRDIIFGTLVWMGWDVLDLGLSSTPTVAWAVPKLRARGGIIITASHNPQEWNALKFLNEQGELLNAKEWKAIFQIAQNKPHFFTATDRIGKVKKKKSIGEKHVQHILNLTGVNVEAIRKANLIVVIDAINSVGGTIVPFLLKMLGVKKIIEIHTQPTGIFNHNPEPIPENLIKIAETTKNQRANVGFAVDPDVDRLAVITEKGEHFGEEYTLVSIADYVFSYRPGNTVSNISSSYALRDITQKKGYSYSSSAVGEVNVVEKMKKTNAVIGGEGNGGIIYPESHYGRDALIGIALFLTNLAISGETVSRLKTRYPVYHMVKHRFDLPSNINIKHLFQAIRENYSSASINMTDGMKIEWPNKWVHIRQSNTEPILRLYAEAPLQKEADELVQSVIDLFSSKFLL